MERVCVYYQLPSRTLTSVFKGVLREYCALDNGWCGRCRDLFKQNCGVLSPVQEEKCHGGGTEEDESLRERTTVDLGLEKEKRESIVVGVCVPDVDSRRNRRRRIRMALKATSQGRVEVRTDNLPRRGIKRGGGTDEKDDGASARFL